MDIALDAIKLCLVFDLADMDQEVHVCPHVVVVFCVLVETCMPLATFRMLVLNMP